ncbi:hypothetical protein A8C75_10700 [Marinobacterium aestuarii]|uniref:Uncharacterized protein n=1 Tax=Marinobacterium aestuarii TaxID=1821621 RepID=A0A1A9EYE5_9GAMM|nr:hypothetical protein [Marinobacterium aestuarii]ANG62907.1 hypothetical protein A8C75_10700 [Marinobacterium aestuarii]
MKRIFVLLISTAAVLFGAAPQASELSDQLIRDARQSCAANQGGQLGYQPGTIRVIDLNRDGIEDEIVDESTYSCTSSATQYCDATGCGLKVIVNNQMLERHVRQWQIIDWDNDRMLLLSLHGSQCGTQSAQGCYEAITWVDGDFRSVRR